MGKGVRQFPWVAVDPPWTRAGRRGTPQSLGRDAEAVSGDESRLRKLHALRCRLGSFLSNTFLFFA